jgi:amidase
VNTHLEKDKAKYESDRSRALEMGGANGIDAALTTHKLDAIIYMGSRGAGIGDRIGHPSITVPFAMVANPGPPLPDGFEAKPMPMGVMFTGTACTEPRLIELAYAFEQATKRRQPPPNMP